MSKATGDLQTRSYFLNPLPKRTLVTILRIGFDAIAPLRHDIFQRRRIESRGIASMLECPNIDVLSRDS